MTWMTWEELREAEEIVGHMGWVVKVQGVLVSLHLVNLGTATFLYLRSSPAHPLEVVGLFATSFALAGASWFARRYQQRLDRELDRLLPPEGDLR